MTDTTARAGAPAENLSLDEAAALAPVVSPAEAAELRGRGRVPRRRAQRGSAGRAPARSPVPPSVTGTRSTRSSTWPQPRGTRRSSRWTRRSWSSAARSAGPARSPRSCGPRASPTWCTSRVASRRGRTPGCPRKRPPDKRPSTAFLDELHALTERRRASFVPLTSRSRGPTSRRARRCGPRRRRGGGSPRRRPRDPRAPRGGLPRGPLRRRDRGPPARARRPGGGRHARPVDVAAGRADGRGTRRRRGPHGRRPDDRGSRRVRRAARDRPRVRAQPHRRRRVGGVPRPAPGVAGRSMRPGRVLLLGTPAEEGSGGKELARPRRLLRRGRRRDHGASVLLRRRRPAVPGPASARVTYHGVAAHAVGDARSSAATRSTRSLLELPGGRAAAAAHPADRPRPRRDPRRRRSGRRSCRSGPASSTTCVPRTRTTLLDLATTAGRRSRDGVARATGTVAELTWDAAAVHPAGACQRRARRSAGRCTRPRGPHVLPGGVVPEILAASTDFANVSVRIPASTR